MSKAEMMMPGKAGGPPDSLAFSAARGPTPRFQHEKEKMA